uniref:Uncharacterized protein n=1 Tax=viral metagenome TaxID=1070528 RepID=A0A6M3IPM2_9ZZZZ
MVEIKTIWLSALILLVITGGTTYVFQSTGTRDLCSNNQLWLKVNDTDNLYYCSSDNTYQYCSELSKSERSCYVMKLIGEFKEKEFSEGITLINLKEYVDGKPITEKSLVTKKYPIQANGKEYTLSGGTQIKKNTKDAKYTLETKDGLICSFLWDKPSKFKITDNKIDFQQGILSDISCNWKMEKISEYIYLIGNKYYLDIDPSFYTTDESTAYNWTSGTFYQTKSNVDNVSLNNYSIQTPQQKWANWDESSEEGLASEDIFVSLMENTNASGNEIGQGGGLTGENLVLTQVGDVAGATGSPPKRAIDATDDRFTWTAAGIQNFLGGTTFTFIWKYDTFADNTATYPAILANGAQYMYIYVNPSSKLAIYYKDTDTTSDGAVETTNSVPTTGNVYFYIWSDGTDINWGFSTTKKSNPDDIAAGDKAKITATPNFNVASVTSSNPISYSSSKSAFNAYYFIASNTTLLQGTGSSTSVYYTYGNYTSQIFDAGSIVNWTNIEWEWTNSTASSDNLTFQTRTSNDATNWESWSSNHTNPSGVINGSARYLQYKAEFSTTDTDYTPYLNWVNVSYESLDSSPTITGGTFIPIVAYTNNTLNCTTKCIDAEDSTPLLNITIYNNSILFNSSTISLNDTFLSIFVSNISTHKSESWKCNATCYDDVQTTTNVSIGIINISDTPPVWYIEPSNQSAQSGVQTNYTINCTDTDDDSITYADDATGTSKLYYSLLNAISGIFQFRPSYNETLSSPIEINATCSTSDINISKIFYLNVTAPTGGGACDLGCIIVNDGCSAQVVDTCTIIGT